MSGLVRFAWALSAIGSGKQGAALVHISHRRGRGERRGDCTDRVALRELETICEKVANSRLLACFSKILYFSAISALSAVRKYVVIPGAANGRRRRRAQTARRSERRWCR